MHGHMAKPLIVPNLRRRGNPDWCRPKPIVAVPTAFEIEVDRLGLVKSEFAASAELKRWCYRHRNHVYVPEWLLVEWGMQVELSFGAA